MNIKKIIAREGLILISLLILGFIVLFISEETKQYNPRADAINIPLTIYIIYLFVRFIIWAIRTLKEKE